MIGNVHQFQRDICDALGLDRTKTRAIELRVAVGEMPVVTVEQFVIDDDGRLSEVLSRYDFAEHEADE